MGAASDATVSVEGIEEAEDQEVALGHPEHEEPDLEALSLEGVLKDLPEPCDRCGSDKHLTSLHESIWLEILLDEEEAAKQAAKPEVPDQLPGNQAKRPLVKTGTEFERGDHTELAARMLQELRHPKGPPLVSDNGALFRYEPKDGIWRSVDYDTQSRTLQHFAGFAIANEKKKQIRVGAPDVSGAIRLAGSQARVPGFFTSTPNTHGVAFQNGYAVVSPDGVTVREHDPANRARWGYTFDYDDKKQPEKFLKFLNAVFRDDEDREQKIAFIQEFAGLTLLGLAPRFSHCLVATSFMQAQNDGQNGKSQLATILTEIMPEGSVACTRPQDFDNEYRRAGLAGKLFNCVGEMPEGDILESASFKAIITGDKIEGRHIRETPFSFYPIAGHYYACNTPPGTGDFTRAFFRRFVFITFSRVFRETDPDFVLDIGKVIVRTERELLPAWALQGAVRALAQNRYTIPPSSEKAIKAWREKVDQVAMFVEEMMIKAKALSPTTKRYKTEAGVMRRMHTSDWTETSSVYGDYQTWCMQTGHKALTSNNFALRMGQIGLAFKKNPMNKYYPVKPKPRA